MVVAEIDSGRPAAIPAPGARAEDEWFVRIVLIGYCTIAWTSILMYVAAYLYARSYDPWLMPRRSPSMIVFQHIQMQHFNITIYMLILCPCACVLASSWFTRGVLMAHLFALFGSCWLMPLG